MKLKLLVKALVLGLIFFPVALFSQPNCALSTVHCVGTGKTFSTIQAAVNVAVAGDTVYVFTTGGPYAGASIASPHVSGTSGNPILLQCQSNTLTQITSPGDPSGDGINVDTVDWVIIDGCNVSSMTRFGIRVVESAHSIVRNNVVHGSTGDNILTGFTPFIQILNNEIYASGSSAGTHNMYVANADNYFEGYVIRGNYIHDSGGGGGLQLNGDCQTKDNAGNSVGIIRGALIERNTFANNGSGHDIFLIDVEQFWIRNNVMYGGTGDSVATGTQCGTGVNNGVIVNNTMDNAGSNGVRITQPATGNIIFNNIIINVSDPRYCVDSSTANACASPAFTNNNFYLPGNNVLSSAASALFTNYSGHDYTLSVGSAARGAASASFQGIPAPLIDYLVNVRPVSSAYDNGAYQYGSSAAGTDTAPTTPTSLTNSALLPNQVSFTWTASTATYGVYGYFIYKNSALYDFTIQSPYTDVNVVAGTTYTYAVAASNFSQVLSTATSPATVTIPGITGCINAYNVWTNYATLPTQSGMFEWKVDATHFTGAGGDVLGLGKAVPGTFTDMAVIINFAATGNILVRNGSVYSADATVPWSNNVIYHFRVDVNVPAHTYTVFVATGSGGETTLASNYAFRSEQASVASLGYFTAENDLGVTASCNLSMNGITVNQMTLVNTVNNSSGGAGTPQFSLGNGLGNAVFDSPNLVALSGNYTLVPGDRGKIFYSASSSPFTITVPSGLGAGFGAVFVQQSTGNIIFTLSGVLHSFGGATHTIGAWSAGSVQCTLADTCLLWGNVQ